jgi:glucose/arabinose dehydrogenase
MKPRSSVSAFALVAVFVLAGTACSSGDDGAATTTTARPTTTTAGSTLRPTTTTGARPLADVRLKLTRVAQLEEPVALTVRRGDDGLYFVEKSGRVRVVRGGRLDPTPALDIRALVRNSGEQGFLGAVFSSDGTKLYVNYTDRGGDGRVAEYTMQGNRAVPSSRRELLFFDDPFPNHNGGDLVIGPDGMLWIGMGDSGSGGDPNDNAQSLGTLFGKMIRIDPRPSSGRPYTIPPDNPFVGRDGARPEIWAFGLRNPWRYSFDRGTGDLWIADVGQNAWEEIDFVAAGDGRGGNFGWALVEGTHRFKGSAPAGAIGPIHEYANGEGGACSVTGGYVYRGARVPGLTGAYVFGDFCVGEVMGMRERDGRRVELENLGVDLGNLASFGQDLAGELYVMSLSGDVARIDPA